MCFFFLFVFLVVGHRLVTDKEKRGKSDRDPLLGGICWTGHPRMTNLVNRPIHSVQSDFFTLSSSEPMKTPGAISAAGKLHGAIWKAKNAVTLTGRLTEGVREIECCESESESESQSGACLQHRPKLPAESKAKHSLALCLFPPFL